MKCKYEHDGDCCNFGSPQYMCKCKPKICHSVAPVTNADRIRAMSDEELEAFLNDWRSCSIIKTVPGHGELSNDQADNMAAYIDHQMQRVNCIENEAIEEAQDG